MTINSLLKQYTKGVQWNAFLYIIYKIISTSIMVFLYARMQSEAYSLYVNLLSIIYLLLLWSDMGLQKAIPRFVPLYAHNTHALHTFMKRLLIIKGSILLLLPACYFLLINWLASALHLNALHDFFYMGTILLFVEGLTNVMRLLYHAHSWQKQFNLMNICTLFIEAGITLTALQMIEQQESLLLALLSAKIAGASLLLLGAGLVWPYVYQSLNTKEHEQINENELNRAFIKHAGLMWGTTIAKSLTERNFLLPLFTYAFGPVTANMFKVANDGALLFYRMVIKSIGTTDTTLFTHILKMRLDKTTWQIAFTNLTTKLAALCIPLSGLIWLLFQYEMLFSYHPFVFHLFLIISSTFLIEAILSPCERILEVHRSYLLLLSTYVPYICIVLLMLTTPIMTSIGLLYTLLCIQGVRLVSSLLFYAAIRIQYNLRFPLRYVGSLSLTVYAGIRIIEWCTLYIRHLYIHYVS